MGAAMGGSGIPNVLVGGSSVEITPENHEFVGGTGLDEPALNPFEPSKLAFVEG
jgi:hypothetical protein